MRIGGGAVSIADVTDRTARDLGFVREFWYNEIRAGRAFTRGHVLGASVGNYPHIQLFNPVGSGIIIIVHRILVNVEATEGLRLNIHNTAITTDQGKGTNLLIGGDAAIGEVRSQDNAAQLGTLLWRIQVLASSPLDIVKDWYLELGAGEGILVQTHLVNRALYVAYDWSEL